MMEEKINQLRVIFENKGWSFETDSKFIYVGSRTGAAIFGVSQIDYLLENKNQIRLA